MSTQSLESHAAGEREAAARPTSNVYSLIFLGLGVLLVFILQAVDAARKARQASPGRNKSTREWSVKYRRQERAAYSRVPKVD